jgi:hypothetical protein
MARFRDGFYSAEVQIAPAQAVLASDLEVATNVGPMLVVFATLQIGIVPAADTVQFSACWVDIRFHPAKQFRFQVIRHIEPGFFGGLVIALLHVAGKPHVQAAGTATVTVNDGQLRNGRFNL